MSIPAASNSETPPQEDSYRPSSCLSSLPDDVILNCLTRVPRSEDLNISCVSKTLRSLVRSPELCRLRSHSKRCHWITLRRGEKMITSTHDYQVEQRSCSLAGLLTSPHFPTFYSSGVSVGSEIYFPDHGWPFPSKKVRVLDTRSGTIRMGPSMKVARWAHKESMGVVDGKIYVIGGTYGKNQVEVFDPETQTWEFAGEEKVQCNSRFSGSLEDKVYMVDLEHGRISAISAYTPREGISNVATESQSDKMNCLCVVENVIYASNGKVIFYSFDAEKMAEYEGKLAVFWLQFNTDHALMKMDIRCRMIALDRVGDEIRGKIEWSGIMATFPCGEITLRHCLVVSAD
ncbi:hypothetical protein BRARA_D01461 [Brassica rapa]|uniref:F-box domain-containing protein n=1 Tax=Brassica campestris TaxID=3711 RepID=A0A397ZTP0_BRACM|nr:hypothetical protein BRARA_D01461 [Brassica rapa]